MYTNSGSWYLEYHARCDLDINHYATRSITAQC